MSDFDEDLLRALGRHARQHTTDEADAALPPLDDRERAAIAQRLAVVVQSSAPRAYSGSPEPAGRPRQRVLFWLRSWTVPLCAAAAVALWMNLRDETGALPTYSLDLISTAAETRSAGTAATGGVRLLPGTATTLVLRPDTAVNGRVEAHVFLASSDGVLMPLSADTTVSNSGAMQLRITAVEAAAPAKLIVVLRTRDAAPPEELARTMAPRGSNYQRWSLAILP